MTYAVEHADALADIAEAGGDAVFTHVTPGTFDPATETWESPTTATVNAKAIEITPASRDAEVYRAATLEATSHRLLLCAATTYGSVPAPGWTCLWAGVTYSVAKMLGATAPDGTAILFRPVLVI